MPLPKRIIEPTHLSRGTVPDPQHCAVPNELEAATNGTLSNAIRQLSSLSRHAEDLFGELTRSAHHLATRASSLQARLDKLAIKSTQLDSAVEEVSLQEIPMRKAFKSQEKFDQQVCLRDTMPTAMLETYNLCDPPPPLYKLNPYREDGKDGMKFYTDPDYFFRLWKQEMLKDTERVMRDKGKKPHKPRSAESGGGRHKKRVRQPHSTRERQRENAVKHGEYIMQPDGSQYAPPNLVVPMEEQYASRSYADYKDEGYSTGNGAARHEHYTAHSYAAAQSNGSAGYHQPIYSPTTSLSRQASTSSNPRNGNGYYEDGSRYQPTQVVQPLQHQQQHHHNMVSPGAMSPLSDGSDSMSIGGTPTRGGAGSRRPSQPPPAPPSNPSSGTPSGCNTPTRCRSISSNRDNLPPPPPPPCPTPPPPDHSPPPPISPIPPPPPPLPQMYQNGPLMGNGEIGKSPMSLGMKITPPKTTSQDHGMSSSGSSGGKSKIHNIPMYDPRNDLLKAIRDGIKLRKVEKIEQKEGDRVNALRDVASILARRVAVEISDSESGSDSEYESDDGAWSSPQQTTATEQT